jgi:hypothetical protein
LCLCGKKQKVKKSQVVEPLWQNKISGKKC